MNNELKNAQNSIIDKMIEYKKFFGQTFPILGLKNASIEQVIEEIDNAIKTNKKFTIINIINRKSKSIIVKDKIDFKDFLNRIKESMESIDYDYNITINEFNEVVSLRKQGHVFSFKVYLRALLLAQLSNQRWGDNNIRKHAEEIRLIFKDYDKEYLKSIDENEVFEELKRYNCCNPNTLKIIKGLKYNISVLENIEKDYGTIDNYLNSKSEVHIASCFNEGKYKLKQVGISLSYDYLQRVGFEICNPSYQLKRLFSKNRIGLINREKPRKTDILALINLMSKKTGYSKLYINYLLWQFCVRAGSNICLPVPNCEFCKLKNECNYVKN